MGLLLSKNNGGKQMKKLLTFILVFILFIFKANAVELDISSKNVILYNLDTNEIIYQKNIDQKVSIASLTKIMTALITVENVEDLNKQTILTKDDFKGLAEANAVTAGFTNGQTVTYKDLLYGLLLPSGADAAKALARNVAGTEENFIKKMNEKVKKLNLKSTNFSTVIGLDDENNYSTVKEFSQIFKEALKNKDINQIITSNTYTTTDGKLTFKSTIQSNASKFKIDIPYVLGGKTGTTTDAGLCLATIAKANNINYMLITTGALYDKKAPHHIIDAKTIYDYFINNYNNQKIVNKNKPFKTIKTKYTKNENLNLYPNKNITKYLNNNYNKKDIKLIYNGIEEVTPFDKKGKTLGTLKIYYKDELLDTQKITLNQTLKFDLISLIKQEKIIIIIVISLLILIILILKKRAK